MRRERGIAVASCLLAVLVLAGCMFSSAPPANLEFASVADLHQLDGRYRNQGEGGPDEWPTYLSALIFPADTALDHASIAAIDVRATNATGS